jgi:hypothetical protein
VSDPGSSRFARLFRATADLLDAWNRPRFVYGGLLMSIWGQPRDTRDIDIVLVVSERELSSFLQAAVRHGFQVDSELSFMQMRINGWPRIPFEDHHIDVTVSRTEFDLAALSRRSGVRIMDRVVQIASAEDFALYKIIAGRPQDRIDVESVFARIDRKLDADYLRGWATRLDKLLGRNDILATVERHLGG